MGKEDTTNGLTFKQAHLLYTDTFIIQAHMQSGMHNTNMHVYRNKSKAKGATTVL